MSSVMDEIPPCPPPRIKSATNKQNGKKKNTYYDDFDDDEIDDEPQPTVSKKTKKKREPIIPSDSGEEEEEEIIPKKSTKKKEVSTKKKKTSIIEENSEDDYVPKSTKKTTKRPVTAKTSKTKKKSKSPFEDEQNSIEDYENNYDDEFIDNYDKNKKNQYSIQKTNDRSISQSKNQEKTQSSSKNKQSKNSTTKYMSQTDYVYKKKDNDFQKTNQSRKSQMSSSIVNVPNQQFVKRGKRKDESIGHVMLGNVGKIFDVRDTKKLSVAKSKLADCFATKKNLNQEDTKNDIENIKEENENSEKKEGKHFTEFLTEINNLKYEGYNYKIKDSDYFENNGKKYSTILNSEDGAIKKCEEIFNSLKAKEKFIDKEFGSQPNDKGFLNKQSLYGNEPVPAGNPNPSLIEWYSINEICDEAKFFDDGTESNDVVQGSLGDCWFISAMSVLATKDYLLRGEFSPSILDDGIIDEEENVMLSTGVYPPIFHSFRKKGIFCFKFWKNFKWRYVIIDDRIPCQKIFNKNQTPTILYGKCRSRREFWVPLIEKGYAKLHGSYKALISGFIDDGLVDLTGLTAKKVMINPEDRRKKEKIEELWKLLMDNSTIDFKKIQKSNSGKIISAKIYTRNKSMMGCSVDPTGSKVEMEVILENQHTGILAGHAYSILDCFEIPKPSSSKSRKTSRLMRIRNPWGRKEWTGKWSDDSEEVISNEKKIREALAKKYEGTSEKISVNTEDGTFIMCFSDFRKIFNKLFICVNFPPNYIGIRCHGEWTPQESGGLPINNTQKEIQDFAKNPQFYFQKETDGKVFISLLQNDGRLTGTKFPFANAVRKACLLIFNTSHRQKVQNLNNLIDKTLIVQRRDLNLELNLPRGEYIIIPSTLTKGETGKFCIELFLEDEIIEGNDSNEPFSFDMLKNTKMEKLGGSKGTFELVSETRSDRMKEVQEEKKKFILSQFQNCLRDDDDVDYSGKEKKVQKIIEDDYDNDDYDDYDEF